MFGFYKKIREAVRPEYKPEPYWEKRGRNYINEAKPSELDEQLDNTIHALEAFEFNSILEYGCGYGRLTEKLFDRFSPTRYVAFDLSKNQIIQAKNHNRSRNIEFIRSTIDKFTTNETFDLVIGAEVLLHIPPPTIRQNMEKLCLFSKKFIMNIDPIYEEGKITTKKTTSFRHDYESIYKTIPNIVDVFSIPVNEKQDLFMALKNGSDKTDQ